MKPIANVNDNHRALLDWWNIKLLMEDIEEDMLKFYGPSKIRKAGVRARRSMKKMMKDLDVVRRKVNKQRQDYESEY